MSSLLDRVGEWWDRQRRRSALMAELDACDAAERARVLHDIGLTEGDLPQLAAGHMSHEYLDRMMTRLGLDKDKLAAGDPRMMGELERSCGRCEDWRRCREDLDAGAIEDGKAPSYCVNRDTLAALKAAAEAPLGRGACGKAAPI